jgi:hypothetical protein
MLHSSGWFLLSFSPMPKNLCKGRGAQESLCFANQHEVEVLALGPQSCC